ncbi:MAG: SIS domain-containing protein [Alphaproteobacteria bacterium]|nr:SIS domain-containing protein [Alphaproteobacteria bacterium]MDE1986317.1 SIS domain-containing protein [Alphaproteobacteria bacterium]MDE2163039.1 SIS domain-containing protein [Alphaproteobacteria bacterium]MDE2499934.1 SIS domain-containing protein [Alphaproteobacteria bacterium]
MFAEAEEAPRAVERQLRANSKIITDIAQSLRRISPHAVVTSARGSSDNAATYAKYLIETKLGVLTSSAAPSVSSVYFARTDLTGTVFLAMSQSGRSPDLLASLETAKRAGAYTVAFVNAENSPLAGLADAVIPLHAGPELSVAATKSFIATNVAIAHLVSAWHEDDVLLKALNELPELLAQAWQLDWNAAVTRLQSARDLYVIGRGMGFGTAQEAALKFKETCALHAEAFSAAEVLHGPMALVKDGFPVFVMSQADETRDSVNMLVGNFATNHADVLLAGFAHPQATVLPTLAANPVLEPVLLIQSFYRMAEALSRARGLDPDAPPHLNKITETV